MDVIKEVIDGYKAGKTIAELAGNVKMSKEYVENTLFRKGIIKGDAKKDVKKADK